MQKHFVTFYSPGTFVHEETRKEIASWDVQTAMEMADTITERYSATPYGFRFTTVDKTGSDWDVETQEVAKSPMYYLGGTVRTYAEVVMDDDPKEDILRSNMRANNIDKVLTNTNSWKTTVPFNEDDVLLDYTPPKREAAAA